MPGARADFAPPGYGMRITQVAWFGYDAVLQDDGIVVVYDEETIDSAIFFGGPEIDILFDAAEGAPNANSPGGFQPAEPPPLAPGLTEPVPPPDPDHMHQLKILRLR